MAYNRITEPAKVPKVKKQITFPKNFTRVQKDYARKLIKQLEESKLISDLDLPIIFKYCKVKFTLDSIEDEMLKVEVGSKQFQELTKTYGTLSNLFIRLSKELSLTPRTVRNKQALDEREVLNTNVEFNEDEEVDLEGWTIEE